MKTPELKKYAATAAAVLGAATYANAGIVHQAVNTTLTHGGDNYSIDFDGDTNAEFTLRLNNAATSFSIRTYSANAGWISYLTATWYPAN